MRVGHWEGGNKNKRSLLTIAVVVYLDGWMFELFIDAQPQ